MKKSSLHILIIILLLQSSFLFSCKEKTDRKILDIFKDVNASKFESNIKKLTLLDSIAPVKIIVPNTGKSKNIKLSEVFDTITFVKLSNEEEAVIGAIDKIVFYNNCIYVLDKYKTKTIKKFSSDGQFLSSIGHAGQGPEEYIEPTDFAVFDEEVIIYDQFRSDMKYYDLEGKLKYQKRTPFLFLNFFMFDSNHYIFQMPGTGNGHLRTIANSYVFESDSSFVLTGMAFSRDDARINDIISNNFYFYNNKAFYNQPYSDTIYSIAPDHKIQIEYIIDFHDKKMPSDMLLKSNEEEFYSLLKTGRYANFTGNYVLTKDYLYFHYSLGGLLHRCFYSKKTKKLITGNGFMNDINFIFPLDIVLTAVDNNVLVGYMQSYYIGENFERNTREEWVKQLGEKYVQIAENIKKEDNPIILFFKFKEF